MRYLRFALSTPAVVLALTAMAASLPADTPLITNGPIVVDVADFEGNILRVPEDRRPEMRMVYDRVATIVDNIYVTRVVAARARELGLDKDPAVQRRLQQVQEGVLADLYMRKMEKEAVPANLEARARELYRADPAKYTTPEHVYVQLILIDYNGRTKAQALERARNVVAQAKAGEDFLTLAARHSDQRDRRQLTPGDLGYNEPRAFIEPVRIAIAKMKTKGEISEPVESDAGYHILRFLDRKPPRLQKFEDVRKEIVAAETERLQKQRLEALIQEVRSSPTVVIHRENVEKVVVPLDPEMMKKAAEREAAK